MLLLIFLMVLTINFKLALAEFITPKEALESDIITQAEQFIEEEMQIGDVRMFYLYKKHKKIKISTPGIVDVFIYGDKLCFIVGKKVGVSEVVIFDSINYPIWYGSIKVK